MPCHACSHAQLPSPSPPMQSKTVALAPMPASMPSRAHAFRSRCATHATAVQPQDRCLRHRLRCSPRLQPQSKTRYGRGRHPTANVPGDFAADRGTTAAAATSACVRRRWSCVQERQMGGVRPNASENGQISHLAAVRGAWITAVVPAAKRACQKAEKK